MIYVKWYIILGIINTALNFYQFSKNKNDSTAMHAAMAVISGLIWPVIMAMNTLDALRIMSLKRIAIKQIKTMNPKFRMWVKQEKKMFLVLGLCFSNNGEVKEVYPILPEPAKFCDWPEPYFPDQALLM